MDSVREAVYRTKEAVQSSTQSGTEPLSGVKGVGTVDQPYDQGNAEEQPTASGVEPPSGITGAGRADAPYDQGNAPEQAQIAKPSTEPPAGIQGKGTADQPYDQGNAPEQRATTGLPSGTEPPSGQLGEGTIDKPYDQGNQPEQPTSGTTSSQIMQPSPSDPLALPSTTHQGSGNSLAEPTKEQAQVIHETRERDETAQQATSATPKEQSSTGTAATGRHFDASKAGAGKEASRLKYEERDVSPGEMRDGTHAVTSGDRGETYVPSKLNKLKDKFGIGRDRG